MIALQSRDKQVKGLLYYIVTVGYVALMVMAFYVSTERRGIIPLLPTITRYACDVGVIGLAVIYFLITFMQTRLKIAGKLLWIWSLPYVGMAMISLLIWIIERAEINYILRGLINVGCAELNAMAVVCAIWMFGEKVVDYTFFGAVGGVALVAVRVIMIYGVGGFFGQYFALLLTFAANTGAAMHYMEFHDLSQGLGLFLLYYIWTFKKDRRHILLLFLSFVCFTLSLKRIDVMAIAAAIGIGWYLNRLTFVRRWYFIIAFEIALVIFAYVYLIIIKKGYYGTIMSQLGIDTMSRDVLYDYYSNFFELSPTFLGKGLRYIYVHMEETDDLIYVTRTIIIRVFAAHNEYITYFIELGFWGFIFWLWSNSWHKINAFRREFGWEGMTVTLMVIIYSFISYATDNTFFYYSINYVGFVISGAVVLSTRKAIEYGV